ncbi:MAG: GNAT family N-acetyltransferase [Candidatus Sericytochromatia bacterium]|nr:GNAT family N-acetyltransferase [Candidatus Tanganyikabacteria bacterium]
MVIPGWHSAGARRLRPGAAGGSRVLTTAAELAEFAPEWARLPDLANPFSGPAFATAWLAGHPEATPRVVPLRDGGRLAAVAPWCIVAEGGKRVLTGMGGNAAWYHDPSRDPRACPLDLVERVVAAVKAIPGWDVARFCLVGPDAAALRAELGKVGWVVETREAWRDSSLVEMPPGGWQAYWESRSKSFRRKHRVARSRVESGGCRWFEAQDLQDCMRWFDRVLAWHGERLRGVRDWSDVHREWRASVAEARERGELHLFCLEVGGEPAAGEVVIRRGRRAFALLHAFDPAHADLSPGFYLTNRNLERLCEIGCDSVDLGPGDFLWKDRLRTRALQVDQIVIGRHGSLRGLAEAGFEGVIKPCMSRLRATAMRRARRAPPEEPIAGADS